MCSGKLNVSFELYILPQDKVIQSKLSGYQGCRCSNIFWCLSYRLYRLLKKSFYYYVRKVGAILFCNSNPWQWSPLVLHLKTTEKNVVRILYCWAHLVHIQHLPFETPFAKKSTQNPLQHQLGKRKMMSQQQHKAFFTIFVCFSIYFPYLLF